MLTRNSILYPVDYPVLSLLSNYDKLQALKSDSFLYVNKEKKVLRDINYLAINSQQIMIDYDLDIDSTINIGENVSQEIEVDSNNNISIKEKNISAIANKYINKIITRIGDKNDKIPWEKVGVKYEKKANIIDYNFQLVSGYLFGGWSVENANYSNSIEKFSFINETSTNLGQTMTDGKNLFGLSVNHRINCYLFGGTKKTLNTATNKIEKFNFISDLILAISNSLRRKLFFNTGMNTFYTSFSIGGYLSSNRISEVFDIETINHLSDVVIPSAMILDKAIATYCHSKSNWRKGFLIGGLSDKGNYSSAIKKVDLVNQSISDLATMINDGQQGFSLIGTKEDVYIFGGRNVTTPYLSGINTIKKIDYNTETLTPLGTNLIGERSQSSTFNDEQVGYISSGFSSLGSSKIVEKFSLNGSENITVIGSEIINNNLNSGGISNVSM